MKKIAWIIPDLLLTAVYFVIFFAVFGFSLPASAWIGPAFFLLAHLSFWVWRSIQPAYDHRYTAVWTVSLPCLVHIILEAVLGFALPLLSASLKLTLVIHIVLLLLSSAVCFSLYSANLADSRRQSQGRFS